MLKSSFAKYITAFITIIFLSFLMLSGIITSIIRGYVSNETEEKLELAGSIVVDHLTEHPTEDLENYISVEILSQVVAGIVNLDTNFNLIVTDEQGNILLTTATDAAVDSEGMKYPVIHGELGHIDVEKQFTENTDDDGHTHSVHRGDLDGLLDEASIVYAQRVVTSGELRGYVLTLSSTVKEDRLVATTRKAVINSSIWVLIAAIIATYFITERIIHPLRTMTSAAKKFAKGDFTARVTVYGKDEVSELAEAFNNMAESLDSLEKMRNSFLANISHDLRTPMTTISGFIDGITSGAIPPEKHGYYLGVISAEVHRLSRLVSQILDVSRLESGERKFSFTDFDVAEVARIILISFEKKIDDKRLDVSFEADSDEMFVNADKDAIYQVLYNLCHNAIKFSREGGKFAIRLERIANKKVQVSIFDEGQSISETDKKLVFDRFYKTDESRGLDKNGVGLGLYICKTIIDAHEEKIWVESVEGESCEFIFTLKEGAPVQKRKPQGELK